MESMVMFGTRRRPERRTPTAIGTRSGLRRRRKSPVERAEEGESSNGRVMGAAAVGPTSAVAITSTAAPY